MKVFISWSGELSKEIASVLKKFIQCLFNYVDVFYSQEDIENGQNWDSVISKELAESNYGIICLTKDNLTAPWINFEAGAIAKSLDARVSALMIDIKTSDIQGPLSRYQATKLESSDMFKLASSINGSLEKPLDPKVLENSFNMMWPGIEKEMKEIVEAERNLNDVEHEEPGDNKALEEILQILRSQNALLSNPEALLPIDYLAYIKKRLRDGEEHNYNNVDKEHIIPELIRYFDKLAYELENSDEKIFVRKMAYMTRLNELTDIISRYIKIKGNASYNREFMELEQRIRRVTRISKLLIKRNTDEDESASNADAE